MFGSRNNFFKQSVLIIGRMKSHMVTLLKIKGRTDEEIKSYDSAFKYFVKNPNKFDGATIVKDLVDVKYKSEYLDVDAMLHDYRYLTGANKNFIKKWEADWEYFKNMERNGKGIRIPRLIILTLMGILFVPYKLLIDKT